MRALETRTDPDGSLVVTLRGEIDFTNATEIGEGISATVNADRPTAVRVDLDEVTFLDSSGIGVLVAAMRLAEDAGATYRVVRPNPKVLDQLRTTGLTKVFGLADPRRDE